MRTKETCPPPDCGKVLATTSGPVVVAAVFCLVFLVMGTAFSFSTFAYDLGRDLKVGSGSISFMFGCAMALLYAGGLFSGALADRIGTHRVAGAGALLAGGSLVAAGAVETVWQADLALGLGFGLGLAARSARGARAKTEIRQRRAAERLARGRASKERQRNGATKSARVIQEDAVSSSLPRSRKSPPRARSQ